MLVLLFQEHAMVSPAEDILRVPFADPKQLYNVTVRLEFIDIRTFGTLLNKFSPIKLRNDGALQKMVSEKMALPNEVEFYTVGDVLAYTASGSIKSLPVRGLMKRLVMGDFSCRIYHIKGQK